MINVMTELRYSQIILVDINSIFPFAWRVQEVWHLRHGSAQLLSVTMHLQSL